ncbi:MAG: tRNA lysidine(34) synthetase TilS [Nitrospirota bacterium]
MQHKHAPLIESFSNALKQLPVGPSDRIVVAVSGGADSMCMLHLLKQLFPPSHLHVAHLNHGFRAESVAEAEFVSNQCKLWGISCTIEKHPVSQICKEKHLSKQEGARIVRYDFLKEVAQSVGAKWIALGHTQDDQVETILQNRLRGAGMVGLRGMPTTRNVGDAVIIRPMLAITREAILSELKAAQISFVEDPSNQDKKYSRNKIRHELIPILQTYNPNIKKVLLRESLLLEEENRFIENYMAELLPKINAVESGVHGHPPRPLCVSFDISLFLPLPLALQRRFLRWGICAMTGHLTGISFDATERILSRMPNAFALSLPHGILARGTKTELTLSVAPFLENPLAIEIALEPAEISIPQWNIALSICKVDQPSHDTVRSTAFFDLDKISSPVTIRRWTPGDRFVPFGMNGQHKKLHDFFIDMKIPKSERNKIPILVCKEGILWVMGYRTDERFSVTTKTKNILQLKMGII